MYDMVWGRHGYVRTTAANSNNNNDNMGHWRSECAVSCTQCLWTSLNTYVSTLASYHDRLVGTHHPVLVYTSALCNTYFAYKWLNFVCLSFGGCAFFASSSFLVFYFFPSPPPPPLSPLSVDSFLSFLLSFLRLWTVCVCVRAFDVFCF